MTERRLEDGEQGVDYARLTENEREMQATSTEGEPGEFVTLGAYEKPEGGETPLMDERRVPDEPKPTTGSRFRTALTLIRSIPWYRRWLLALWPKMKRAQLALYRLEVDYGGEITLPCICREAFGRDPFAQDALMEIYARAQAMAVSAMLVDRDHLGEPRMVTTGDGKLLKVGATAVIEEAYGDFGHPVAERAPQPTLLDPEALAAAANAERLAGAKELREALEAIPHVDAGTENEKVRMPVDLFNEVLRRLQ